MLIPLFILIPLAAFVVCTLLPNRWEKAISAIAVGAVLSVLALFGWTLFSFAQAGFVPVSQAGMTLYASAAYEFSVHFYMDVVSTVFFGVTCLTTLLVLLFSKYYMHRDPGFRRFHSTILFFFAGLALIIFSGNFETLFVGWEFIGISSFLLISFYRFRFLPNKNSLKVFSLYRIADALFLIALWYAHHLFGHNIQFTEFASLVSAHGNELVTLGLLFVVVAMIKSAQFPFSYWLPRAMEGPTTSSAIFYGALSVHIGLFLLLRTAPLWEGSLGLRVGIMLLGLLTVLVATSITRVQSSIKTQIAYASVTQIGIMFIELAVGLHTLVLFHFVSHACLRAYQLLISPSIVSYLVHYQFYTFEVPAQKIRQSFMGKVRATLFILGIKEWNMDRLMSHHLWQPLKRAGQWLKFLDSAAARALLLMFWLFGAHAVYAGETTAATAGGAVWASAILSLLFFVRAYASKGAARQCWTQIFFGQLFVNLFLYLLSGAPHQTIWLSLAGITIAYLAGASCLLLLEKSVGRYDLVAFHGFMYAHPLLGNGFFIASLAMMMFPITPAFIGEEILLSLIHVDHLALIVCFALGYVLSGVSAMRLFSKVFFGPYKKTYHEVAYESS